MITRTKIGHGKDSCTGKLIKRNVDAGQWILVLDSNGIQRPVVNTLPQGLVFLLIVCVHLVRRILCQVVELLRVVMHGFSSFL
jgi:hypothetical protein